MAKIKLFKIGEVKIDGKITERFQTQLSVIRKSDSADFVRSESDGIMRVNKWRPKLGFNFHPYEGEYEIVENIKEMQRQEL